jgi:hypothetical protein
MPSGPVQRIYQNKLYVYIDLDARRNSGKWPASQNLQRVDFFSYVHCYMHGTIMV